MKKLSRLPGTLALLALGVFGTVFAPITAFGFSVDTRLLCIVCALCVLVAGTCVSFWGGRGLAAALAAALVAMWFVLPSVAEGGRAAVCAVTTEMSAYLTISPLFPRAWATPEEYTLFFSALGYGLALALAAAVSAKRSAALPAFLITLPIVGVSFSFVAFPPALWCALALTGFTLALLLRHGIAAGSEARRHTAVWPALALAGLVLAAGYALAPPEDYAPDNWSRPVVAAAREALPWLQPFLDQVGGGLDLPVAPAGVWYFNTGTVSVADAGARAVRNQRILSVTADQPGDYYLRGHSMTTFDGRAWRSGAYSGAGLSNLAARIPAARLAAYNRVNPTQAEPYLTMEIVNEVDLSGMLYLPYYADFDQITADGARYTPVWKNDSYLSGGAESYQAKFYHPSGNLLALFPPDEGVRFTVTNDGSVYAYTADLTPRTEYDSYARSAYTSLPDKTAQALRELAAEAGIDANASREVVAAQVADYVMSAARYSLRPSAIPAGEDFAVYFLTERRLGYCVHFATAATLMLRALDVPARFTSGFRVTVRQPGVKTAVTDGDAHAWVEVYYAGVGWVPLEVTPSYVAASGPAAPYAPPEDDPLPTDRPPATSPSAETPSPTQSAPAASPTQAGPSGNGNGDETTAPSPAVTIALLGLLAICLTCGLAVVGRRYAQKRRAALFAQPDANAAVLCAWRYIARLRPPRGGPPEEIETLALKARFSQHTLSEQERAAVVSYATELAGKTDAYAGVWGKLRLRYLQRLY